MYYLMFALLQQGHLNEAQKVVSKAKLVPSEIPGGDKCGEDDSLIMAGYILETGAWERAKDIESGSSPYGMIPALVWMVKGEGAARTGDPDGAHVAEEQLAMMRDTQMKHSHQGGTDTGAEASRLTVAAWVAHAAGKKEEAVNLMRQAADMQDRLGGSASVFKPLREQLADMLLQDGENKEAFENYSAVLKSHPNRFDALFGGGTAAFAAGNESDGRQFYSKLIKLTSGDERPELVTARKRMTEQSAKN
jgi:tetratricopeptide (TPR) repeat protein